MGLLKEILEFFSLKRKIAPLKRQQELYIYLNNVTKAEEIKIQQLVKMIEEYRKNKYREYQGKWRQEDPDTWRI